MGLLQSRSTVADCGIIVDNPADEPSLARYPCRPGSRRAHRALVANEKPVTYNELFAVALQTEARNRVWATMSGREGPAHGPDGTVPPLRRQELAGPEP